MGNTCFANSILQCLRNAAGTPPEAEEHQPSYLTPQQRSARETISELTRTLTHPGAAGKTPPALVLDGAWTRLHKLGIHTLAVNPTTGTRDMQDAAELLIQLGNLTLPPPDIEVQTTRLMKDCQHTQLQRTEEPRRMHELHFWGGQRQEPTTLEDLLEYNYTILGEPLEETFTCSSCGARGQSVRQRRIVTNPQNVIIHLVRQRWLQNGTAEKITTKVAFPTKDLDMSQHTVNPSNPALYGLTGAVYHTGSGLTTGHYTAAVLSKDNTWYICDDAVIRPTTEAEVCSKQAAAYILFYRKYNGNNK